MPLFFRVIVLVTFILLVSFHSSFGRIEKFRAAPDQVLVLYNKDYRIDVDGSEPIQDSEEVARYFVKMHTDPKTGKKPHLLGLHCRHGQRHLNHWVIKENSDDNKNGVMYIGKQKGIKKEAWVRDSRHVEIVVKPKGKALVDWDSIQMICESVKTGSKVRVAPKATGIPHAKRGRMVYPQIQEGKGRCFRFNAKSVFSGTVRIYFRVKDMDGRLIKDLKLTYFDVEDFQFSVLGKDKISDELHFQEDVAIPVKAFLEDKKNQWPDGTQLKDHILYIVVCHGLPFSCEGVFGIERGATSNTKNHGDLGSLEQRLQTLYYGWGKPFVPPVISMYLSGGPGSKDGVRNHRITTALRYPLAGQRWNPYMHPDTYSFLGSKKEPTMVNMPPLVEKRKELPSHFFAYGVSRIDGQGPVEAKRQIDYAIYANKYLRPEIDLSIRSKKKADINMSERLALAARNNAWGASEEEVLGFRIISSYGGQGIPFLTRPLEDSKTGRLSSDKTKLKWSGYYPGGMDRSVYSGNGWNMGRNAAIWKQVDQGVTLSACGGPAYGGGPHITNATFWDNRIMLRYLFRGRDLGECFLMSTYYINWSTSLIGDPLLHPDLSLTVKDTTAPRVGAKSDIQVKLVPAMEGYAGQIEVPVVSTAEKPEVATLEVYYKKQGASDEMTSRWPIYSTRPKAVLRQLEPNKTYMCRLVLTDPYGNVTDVSQELGDYQFRTGDIPEKSFKKDLFYQTKKGWQVDLTHSKPYADSGTIEVVFSSKKRGGMPVIRSRDIKVGRLKGQSGAPFQIGGQTKGWSGKMDLPLAENITMILRWRRFPLTRELIFRAKSGKEWTFASDVRTPWEGMALKDIITLKAPKNVKIHSARMYADAHPASDQACAINVEQFDSEYWKKNHL